jgi:hypothetical protein
VSALIMTRLTQFIVRAAVPVTCALSLAWAATSAHAQPADAKAAAASPASGASTAAANAAPDKVYPPLPTLAMLPPPQSDDDDAPAAPAKRGSRGKKGAVVRKNEMPAARLVVSDTSRSYLTSIEQEIDHAMQK